MNRIVICFLCFATLSFANVIKIDSKNIDVPKKLEKIVAIGPGALRYVTYMQLDNRLVGVEKVELQAKRLKFLEYSLALGKKRVSSLPFVGMGGPGKLPNLEKIIALKPDIIVASEFTDEQANLIANKTKIPLISLDYGHKLSLQSGKKRLNRMMSSLKLLGKVFKKERRANELISFMKKEEKLLREYKLPNKKIYTGGLGFRGVHGITSSEKHYLPFYLLNINNPLTKKAKVNHMIIQEESLILYNPDIIFIDLHGKLAIDEEMSKKKHLYKLLTAYKENKIFWLLPYNFYNTNLENIYINSWIILKRVGINVDIEKRMLDTYKVFYGSRAQKVMDVKYPLKEFKCIK